jgi:cytochrome c553
LTYNVVPEDDEQTGPGARLRTADVTRATTSVLFGVAGILLGAAGMRYYDAYRAGAPSSTARGPASPAAAARVTAARVDFDREPLWAYGFVDPPKPGDAAQPQSPPTHTPRANQDLAEQTRPRHVAGSEASYSLVEIRDLHNVADWFPGDHPRMTPIVLHGPAAMGEQGRGCGSCHLPNGRGRPENAPIAGLPTPYFIRQIEDFRSGRRRSADPRKPNTNTMIALAKAMTDPEAIAAAEYFESIPPPVAPWIRVVESDTVPKTRIVGNLFLPAKNGGQEAIGGRIIEMPEDEEQGDVLRNPRSGFVAYVPIGSVARGEDLVTTGGMKIVDGKIVQGRTTACGTCHGPQLMGVADVPPIAGRSPSYMVRQMWDMQQGTRNGPQAQLMKLVVANLNQDDLVSIAAYVASRIPVRPDQPRATARRD